MYSLLLVCSWERRARTSSAPTSMELATSAVQKFGVVALHALCPGCEVLGRLLVGGARRGRSRRGGSRRGWCRRGQGHVQQDGPGDITLAVLSLSRPTHFVAVDEGSATALMKASSADAMSARVAVRSMPLALR